MRADPITTALSAACATLLLAACDEPTTPRPARPGASAALASSPREPAVAAADAVLPLREPFTVRAPLDPFMINQGPDFMIRSRVRADLVMQRLVARPGVGAWHTHPGPSFGIVEQGQVMLTRYTKRGCTTDVYGPGQAYYEVADQVHRVTVLGTTDAVEYKARFNTPVGAPFSAPADDPGCVTPWRPPR